MCGADISRETPVSVANMCGQRGGDLANVGRVICPKCQNTLRTVDRQGIHIDQCDGCRGIFLDRGELESILNAERQYSAAAPPPYQGDPYRGAPPPPPGRYADSPRGGYGRAGYGDSPRGYAKGGHGYADSPHGYHGGHGGHRRRKSFIEQLFD